MKPGDGWSVPKVEVIVPHVCGQPGAAHHWRAGARTVRLPGAPGSSWRKLCRSPRGVLGRVAAAEPVGQIGRIQLPARWQDDELDGHDQCRGCPEGGCGVTVHRPDVLQPRQEQPVQEVGEREVQGQQDPEARKRTWLTKIPPARAQRNREMAEMTATMEPTMTVSTR